MSFQQRYRGGWGWQGLGGCEPRCWGGDSARLGCAPGAAALVGVCGERTHTAPVLGVPSVLPAPHLGLAVPAVPRCCRFPESKRLPESLNEEVLCE